MANFLPSDDEATQRIRDVISKGKSGSRLQLLNSKKSIAKLCKELKSHIDWNFDFKTFYGNLCTEPQLPLNILWNLHIFQIMPLEIFLLNANSKNTLLSVQQSICAFVLQKCHEDWFLFSAQTGLIAYLIAQGFPVSDANAVNEAVQQVCHSIIEGLLENVFSLTESEIDVERVKPLISTSYCGTLEPDSLQSYNYFALQKFISHSQASETDAFMVQEKWTSKVEPFHHLIIVEKFIDILKLSELEQILTQALRSERTNWKKFSVVIAALSSSTEEKSSLINALVLMLVKDALNEINPKSLKRAMLIGRQTSLKANSHFAATYASWIQVNIRDKIPAKNTLAFSLLIEVLSDLLPYENDIECLKTFLQKPMIVPHECQPLYSDYIVLLKTRVKDLQPRVKTEHIMERVLNTFQETGKIPPYILEASLMNKHHYLNEFLPVLLAPRMIPNVPDTKEKFIDLLYKSGKIPSNIIQKYKLACQQEQQKLLAGINIDEENSIEFMETDIEIIN